jgi:aspartate-semialdehyde dehydrogenase
MSNTYTVAILGATGLVGTYLRELLEVREFPLKELRLLASERSAGERLAFKGEWLTVEAVSEASFKGVDIVLASAGGAISEQWVPIAVKHGAVVIDNTSHFRLKEDVPLVVAGVNDADLEHHKGIVANPNCSTAQLMPVLKALNDAIGLKRVIVSTYQSVSGAGKEAMQELLESSRYYVQQGEVDTDGLMYKEQLPENAKLCFERPMAFNVVPKIDTFSDEDYTKEELKLVYETRKMLHMPNLPISATAVRVPVLVGHSEAVTIDFVRPTSPSEVRQVLERTPNVVTAERSQNFATPRETAGTDPVYVGRIRRDLSNPEAGVCLWVVADNLRIGAALNAVRLAETLVQNSWLGVGV